MFDALPDQQRDEELVRRTLEGDKSAFDSIEKRYRGYVFSIACRLLGDAHSAEDATQEIFLNAFRHLGKLKRPSQLKSWLRSSTLNYLISKRRAKSRHPEETPLPASDLLEDKNSLFKGVALREVIEQALTPRQYELFCWAFHGDLSNKEIAKEMGLAISTVKSLKSRICAALRERINQLGGVSAFLGGGEAAAAQLQLLYPLDTASPLFAITFAQLSGERGQQVVDYDVCIQPESGDAVRITDISPAIARRSKYCALLGGCPADLIAVSKDDPRLAPIATARTGDCTITVSAWSNDGLELARSTIHVTLVPPDGADALLVDKLKIAERISMPLRRDIEIFDLLDDHVSVLETEQMSYRTQVGAGSRRAAITCTLNRLRPLRLVYGQRLVESFTQS